MDKNKMMENIANEAHEKGVFTGTWLYAEKGEIISSGAVGYSDPFDKIPVRQDSVFDMASVSKQFTAAAVMLLRRRGLLHLEDEITKFFPQIPYKGVTVYHLLTHTGGLPDYMGWVDKTARAENTIPKNEIIVRFLCECGQPPVFAPGEKWEYSNTGYCLLAQIVEKVSGVPFEEFIQKNIFDPANLTSTHVYHRRKDKLNIENLAYGMVPELDSDTYKLQDDLDEFYDVVTLDGMSGDGLVHTNVFDLLKWDRVLREGTLLTKEEQQLMYTPARLKSGEIAETDEHGEAGYGFGWCVKNDPEYGLIVYHSGGWPGYALFYERFIDADKVFVRLCCRDALDEQAYDAFADGLRDIAYGREPKPVKTTEELAVPDPDRSGWERFCGKYGYEGDGFHIEEIVLKGGDLYAEVVTYAKNRYSLKLYPFGNGKFGIKRVGELEFGDGTMTIWGETHKKL